MKLGDVELDQEPAFNLDSKVRVRKKFVMMELSQVKKLVKP